MAAEPQKFDSFGKEWWDPKGRFISLHRINPLRFNYFSEKIGGFKDKRVLDIGCGGGILSEELEKAGAFATGIDFSPVSLVATQTPAEKTGVRIGCEVR